MLWIANTDDFLDDDEITFPSKFLSNCFFHSKILKHHLVK